jgi:phosphinothricin acetyltransferase
VELRLATPDDAAAVSAIYAPFVAGTPISFEVEAPDAAEMTRRLATAMPLHPFLVAVDADQVVGYAYGGSHNERAAYRWSVNVSVYVDRGRHRTGVGRSLYRALLALLAAQGYRQAIAGITLPSPASVGIHEAMGFRPVGIYRQVGWKLGAWHDVGWWQLTLDGSDGAPDEVRRVDQLDPSVIEAVLQG